MDIQKKFDKLTDKQQREVLALIDRMLDPDPSPCRQCGIRSACCGCPEYEEWKKRHPNG